MSNNHLNVPSVIQWECVEQRCPLWAGREKYDIIYREGENIYDPVNNVCRRLKSKCIDQKNKCQQMHIKPPIHTI